MADVKKHKPLRFIVMVMTFLLYVLFLASPAFLKTNFADPSVGVNSTFIHNNITPARWTFGVLWGTIFLYQFIWLSYGLTTLCRHSPGAYLYYSPPYLPPALYLTFAAICLTLMLWYALFEEETAQGRILGCVLLYLSVGESYLALGLSFRALQRWGPELVQQERPEDVTLVRALVQNGLGELATWLSLAAMLNLTIVLNNDTNMPMETGSALMLFFLAIDVSCWVMLDNFLLYKYTSYLFTPYIVLIIALAGIIARNFEYGSLTTTMVISLLVLTALGMVLKVVLVVIRGKKKIDPILGSEEYSGTLQEDKSDFMSKKTYHTDP